ncbi:lysostaphin resistance A-like protein [Candidatus Lokiarchaeum ossiferum]|uniref:lysostaphin resistance A-like protein n=1 Tax=Candidatus Lokiarchaeum ossiferum TaxID=2951803 RepID=UPI00352C86FF
MELVIGMREAIKKRVMVFFENIRNQVSKKERWALAGSSIFLSVLVLTRYNVEHTEAYIIVLPLFLIFGGLCILGLNTKNKNLSNEVQSENLYWKSGRVLWYGGFIYLGILILRLFLTVNNLSYLFTLKANEFLLFIIVCISGLVEEFFFRKGLLTLGLPIENHRKMIYGLIFFQSLMWTVFHFQYYDRPLNLLVVFIMGLYYGFLYSYSQEFWKPALLHALTNIIGLIYNFSIYLQ